MRKILCFILFLAMILTACVTFGESAAGLTKDVKILFTSDVHCGIDQGWGYSGIYAVRENLARDGSERSRMLTESKKTGGCLWGSLLSIGPLCAGGRMTDPG